MSQSPSILLVLLDGLGDIPSRELDGQTPAEAAQTPLLDRLAAAGRNGCHLPFGPGVATSSEVSHWSLFGYERIDFIGRAALEGLGQGLALPSKTPLFQVALRAGTPSPSGVRLGERAQHGPDDEDARALFAALDGQSFLGVTFELLPLRTGEAVLCAHGAESHHVSDSDALFEHLHPWMQPQALARATSPAKARSLAQALTRWLQNSRRILQSHNVNDDRRQRQAAVLDTPVSKWASWIDPDMPNFSTLNGFPGAQVTDKALYRGFAKSLGMPFVDLPYDAANPAEDMRKRLQLARGLLRDHAFVHLHIKATDEAGHRKDPRLKQAIIEATEQGLAELDEIRQEAIVAVTGDHATPSSGPLMHSGDPTPLLVVGPGVVADSAQHFGEKFAMAGALGMLKAKEILPMLAGAAQRPFFRGHNPGPWEGVALPEKPLAMTE